MAYASGEGKNDVSHVEEDSVVISGQEIQDQHVPAIVIRERTLKKSIANILGRLGSGLCDPVPYETAWVARIPLKDDLSRPAFPLSLQWLRNEQQDDGSWGKTPPFSPHSSTLNTLAAILALAQWGTPDDELRILRGVKALWDLAPTLPSDETHMGVGFELILPVLQKEAQNFHLDIPHEYYGIYEQKGRRKLELIHVEFKKNGYSKPATWWHNLEILGHETETSITNNYDIHFSSSMLLANGSVAASPSATAYILRSERLKGRDIPEADNYIQKIYSFHQGGISQTYPIDIFELAFGIDFFLKAGVSANDPLLVQSTNLLSQRCTPGATIGFCSQLDLPDADDTAVVSYVLHQAGHEVSVDTLLKFFNGSYISCFMPETDFSVSTNINALQCLRLFEEREDVKGAVKEVVNFLKNEASHETQVIVGDKWHKSPYYSTSRAIFSLHGLEDNLVCELIEFLVKSQNDDGGWGEGGYSTAEESAYVILALCFAHRKGHHFPEDVLKSAKEFLFGTTSRPNAELWIAKVLYRPTLIAESAILSAQYVLTKTLDLTAARTILMESKPHYVTLRCHMGNVCAYTGNLLSFSSGFDTAPYSGQIARVRKHIVDKLTELKLMKTEYAEEVSLDIFIHCIRGEVSDEYLKLYSFLGMAITLWDDILDTDWEKYTTNVGMVQQVFQTFWEILNGRCKNINNIKLPLAFPNFLPFCKLFFVMRQQLTSRPNDLRGFLIKMKKYFDNDIANLLKGLPRSSEEYLEMKHRCMGQELFCSISNMLNDLDVLSFEKCEHFLEIEYYGSRAARLVVDIFAFPRDQEEAYERNYVLLKRDELGGSLVDAIDFSVKLHNQFIMRILSAKRNIQNDPVYKGHADLMRAISAVECFVDGIRDWASQTARYKSRLGNTCVRLSEIFKPVTELDLHLIIDVEKEASLI